jgi:hypothetical protein
VYTDASGHETSDQTSLCTNRECPGSNDEDCNLSVKSQGWRSQGAVCTIVNLKLLHQTNLCVESLYEEAERDNVLDNEENICLCDKSPLWVCEVDLIAFRRRDYGLRTIDVRHDVVDVGKEQVGEQDVGNDGANRLSCWGRPWVFDFL